MKEITSKILKIAFGVGLMSTILEIVMYIDWFGIGAEQMPNLGVFLELFMAFSLGIFGVFLLFAIICITGVVFLITSIMYLIAYLINRKSETKWKKTIGIFFIIVATIISAITTLIYIRLESIVFAINIFKGIIYAIPAIIDILLYIYIFVNLINHNKKEKQIEVEIKNEIAE